MADAGPTTTLPYSGANPPKVRLEGLPDGTAFALWERNDPLTVASARFFNNSWESPAEGSGGSRARSWLAVSLNGAAIVTWTESFAGGGYGVWSRRYLPGKGWLAPERLSSQLSFPLIPRSIGADPPEPGSATAVVMSDAGRAQAVWNRGYFVDFAAPWGWDVSSARLVDDTGWTSEEVIAPGSFGQFFRVSRTNMIAMFEDSSRLTRPQVFEAGRGWLEPGKPLEGSAAYPLKIVAAKGGFAMATAVTAGLAVRGLAENGELGPEETLIPGVQVFDSAAPRYDICGNESGAFAFARSDTDSIIFKYRSASDTPPSFATTTVIALGRPVTEPLACFLDRAGRALMVWRIGQDTLVNRYLPGTGFEGATSIGPAFATTPALAEDEKGNILVTWAVLTADKRVEIWWNRLRNP